MDCWFLLFWGVKTGVVFFCLVKTTETKVSRQWRSTHIRRELRDQFLCFGLCTLFLIWSAFCCCGSYLLMFCGIFFFFFAHTTVSPVSPEDFAHCKDEMDVIIVHCGFRLCTVKLWTVKCTGKFLWKKTESLEEPVKRLLCMPRFFWDYKCVNFTFSVHKLK